MKKFLPYIFSLLVGSVFGYLIFNSKIVNTKLLNDGINATAFQLGVFTSKDSAEEYLKKYPESIIMQDNDVFRVYYSILTNQKVINKMEKYLLKNKIFFYKKDITLVDKGLIKALKEYETSMIDVQDNTFFNLNKIIMESYGGNIWN